MPTIFFRKISIALSLLILSGTIFWRLPSIQAEEKTASGALTNQLANYFQQYQKTVTGDNNLILKSGARLFDMKNALNSLYGNLLKTRQGTQSYSAKVDDYQVKIDDLNAQLNNLSTQIEDTKTKIDATGSAIIKKQVELENLVTRIEIKKIELRAQKKVLNAYVRALYARDGYFYDYKSTGLNPVKLLLADANVSDTLSLLEYLKILENSGEEIFQHIQNLETTMRNDLTEKTVTQEQLQNLKIELEQEHQNLELTKAAREELLNLTQGEQGKYKNFLEESKKEESQVADAIKNLSANVNLIQKKLAELRTQQAQSQNNLNTESQTRAQEATVLGNILRGNQQVVFDWPVPPSRGLTAYYHDQDYEKTFGVVHNAIDIRQPQGSEVYAPTDGFVYKVRNGGEKGYSFVILAHENNFLTVYGHLSEISVQIGDLVKKGQLIGLSGGMPGTPGAGWMTTGPHLHFEVYKDGEHVDPLDYLPLEYLPLEYIPEDKLKAINLGEALESGSGSTKPQN